MGHTGWRWLVTLVAPLMFGFGVWNLLGVAGLPINVDRQTLAVTPLLGMPLPPGVRQGDIIDWVRADRTTRLELWDLAPVAGETVEVPLLRDGKPLTVPVQSVRLVDAADLGVLIGPAVLFWLLMLVIGLLTLWRGRDAVAAGLSLSALCIVAMAPLNNPLIPVSPPDLPAVVAGVTLLQILFSFGAWFGWFWMARGLAEGLLPPARLRLITGCFAGVMGAGFVTSFAGLALRLFTDQPPSALDRVAPLLFAIRLLLILALFGIVLVRSAGAQRLRAQWIAWSVALLQVNTVVAVFLPQWSNSITWQMAGLVPVMAGGIGLLYAALRHRMVDIAFVLNRAMVFAVLTTAVVGAFALLENLIEGLAVGHEAGLAMRLGAPLLLGISINRVHQHVEHLMERLVFRDRHRREQALKAFAHRAAFIETESALLAQTVDEVVRNAESPAVAVYDRHGARFRRLQAGGAPSFPIEVDVDDPACVMLKANAPFVNLESCTSALASSGLALPMMQRGRLAGFIVCAARPAEDYAPDERQLLATVAREVGAALGSLRLQESDTLVAALAAGALDAQQAAEAARSLVARR